MSARGSSKTYGVTPELAILAGGGVAAVLGALFGALSIRRSGIYLTMITLALAQLVYLLRRATAVHRR